jgi:CheY-like chemotaxis protein
VALETETVAPAEPELAETPPGGGDNGDAQTARGPEAADRRFLEPAEVPDDRATITPADRVLLVVCPDADRVAGAVEAAQERGFKALAALQVEAGVALAHEFVPDAIMLALEGDGTGGASALDHLKRHPQTRHIPVYVEAEGDRRQALLRAGAAGHVEPPEEPDRFETALDELEGLVDRRGRRLLVVEDDETQRQSIVELIGSGDDVEITALGSSEEALEALENEHFDCVVLDLKLPQMQGFSLLETIKEADGYRNLPVIVYTGKELTGREEEELRRYAEAIIVKDANSPERLLDETSLHLHRPEARLPADKRRMLERLRNKDAVFQGKKILLVDDDVRNVFALASVLESRGMEILFAENGKDGIETLRETPDVDLVLMDIMMPEMDGHEATRQIRGMEEFKQLPIVALTAKAMKGDREKSLAAGASDYIAKPVDIDRLLSLMRVWLHG